MAKVINKRKNRNFLLNEKLKITAIDNKRSIKADPKSGWIIIKIKGITKKSSPRKYLIIKDLE